MARLPAYTTYIPAFSIWHNFSIYCSSSLIYIFLKPFYRLVLSQFLLHFGQFLFCSCNLIFQDSYRIHFAFSIIND